MLITLLPLASPFPQSNRETPNENSGNQRFKSYMADSMDPALVKIANAEKVAREDDEQGDLQGALDDEMDRGQWMIKGLPKDMQNVQFDSFIVQKLRKEPKDLLHLPPRTTYHLFDDEQLDHPIFTRSVQDFNVDFIIFANPAYPPGTGHYVVLRKITSQNDIETYDLNDNIGDEDEFDYETSVTGETTMRNIEGPEPENMYRKETPGRRQSVEEDFADYEFTGPNGETPGEGLAEDYEYTVKGQLPYPVKIRVAATVQGNAENPGDLKTRVVYEAFSVNFKYFDTVKNL